MSRGPRPVSILLFASAGEAVGRSALEWTVPKDGISVRELLRRLEVEYPRLRPTLQVSRFVRNGRYLRGRSGSVRPGDEFAVHPPYGGG